MFRITLRQLEVFRAVARFGGTGAAGGTVGLSQSAASASLNELERTLGTQLFDRTGRRLRLNATGAEILPRILALLDAAGEIERCAQDEHLQMGRLRIGASTTIGNYLLPGMLASFRGQLAASAQAAFRVSITVGNTASVAALVADFELDCGLIEGPCQAADLLLTPWLEDDLVIVAGRGDPLARRHGEKVSLRMLRDATWLLREPGSGTRDIINSLLLPHLDNLKAGIEFGDSEAIKRAVANGLGITCLPRCVVEDLITTGSLIVLRTGLPPLKRRLHIVTHRRKSLSTGLQRLIAYLQAQASEKRPRARAR